MYKNPLLNNSIYDSESCSRSNNYSNVVRGDNEVFFANAKVNANVKKVTNCVSKSKMNFNHKQHQHNHHHHHHHQQQLPYHSLLTHTHSHIHTLSKNKSAITTTATTHKHPTITKTIFTKLSENIYKSINTNINTNIYSSITTTNNTNNKFSFNYDDFINENTLSSFHNKLTNPHKNKKIIQSFIERSTSRQKKVMTCSRNKYCGSFGPNMKQKKKTVHHCNSSRTPEQFYTEQKQFLEKKENNIALLKNNIQSVENLIVQDKPTINANTVNIALKKQKCKDVYIRLYKKKQSSDKDMLKESTSQKAYTSNNSSNILHQPHSITNSVYIRLTSRNNSSRTCTCTCTYKTPKSTSNEKSTSLRKAKSPALTSNESLCILLDKFLTSFELCLTNICNCTLRSVSYDVVFINKEQLNNILNKLHCTQGNAMLLESTWKELVVKSDMYNDSTQMVSLQHVLLFLLSVLGFLREYTSNSSKSLPKYVSSRLNGVISIDDVKSFEKKGQNVSQININFQEMRNNYFNCNFYASKDSTTTNTPEHVSHKPKTKFSHKQCVISLYDTYKHTKAVKEQQLNDKRKLNLQKELSLCTFTPDLSLTNKQNISLCNNMSITSRLYTDAQKKQHQQRICNTRVCNNDNMCLLKQTHHGKLNHEMFIKNPLQNDRSVITKCEMMKQARCEQKKKNYYFQRGEPCKNEDHCYHSYRKYCNTLYSTSDFEIAVDINSAEDVKRKGKVVDVKSFVIKKGENAIGKINEFCRKYGLNKDSKEQIIMEVKDKIETAM